MAIDLSRVPWRVGRSVGRTIYAQTGLSPGALDTLIGVMDTTELAAAAVEAHNQALAPVKTVPVQTEPVQTESDHVYRAKVRAWKERVLAERECGLE